ncbi:unnamed protein product [Medioppia subpectinata]|uniref:Protein RIC1 homolog n=1 Tax=Medioppia subpectinata TaxID=1979941 RepID=A0A7R9PTP5_9ACAR|nr:unnamed protein product [Medioppia subpectinata]CAG2100866.1 unnamed protein product [Medioppia subpectinata]
MNSRKHTVRDSKTADLYTLIAVMYWVYGWPQTLRNTAHTLAAVANTDRSLFGLLSRDELSIWYFRPSVRIVVHKRNSQSLQDFGSNVAMVWRPDSSLIVVQTDEDFLLFYNLIDDPNDGHLLDQKDVDISGLRRESSELFITEKIPSLILILMAAEEEIVIGTKNGEICGIHWDGSIDETFIWKLTSKTFSATDDINVVDIKYSSMIGGFGLVFSCGRAAFMPLHSHPQTSTTSQPSTPSTTPLSTPDVMSGSPQFNSRLQFVSEVDNACSCAINHKYQLIAFGLNNTEGVVCCLDDTQYGITITHRLVLSGDTFPDASFTAGALTCIQWTPDSTVLATAWQRGGFALWSVFGALIACSFSWDLGAVDAIKSSPFIVNSMAFGKEGYHLWLATRSAKLDNSNDKSNNYLLDGVSKLSMAKSVIASNPSSSINEELVLLTSEDRLFIGIGAVNVGQQQQHYSPMCSTDYIDHYCNGSITDDIMPSTNCSSGEIYWEQQPIAVGNLQWIVINMPQRYLATNWPIRYAAIDNMSQHIVIAGRTGLAHYSISHRKWKLFGNETQEKDFEVCGGLLWCNEHIVLSCYNVMESRYELRTYSHKYKLDNEFVRVLKVDMVPPECVTLVVLTNLHIESTKEQLSILMNICGRLLLLEKESTGELSEQKAMPINTISNDNKSIVYKKVSILASGVENVWIANTGCKSDRPHLTESLYVSCGANGMGVWLPLLPVPEQQTTSHSFMSKRIMLPIATHIYPLAILFRDAVMLGAENDTVLGSRHLPISLPFSVVSRTSQVYLHHILRELLRRNLGLHAWEIANSCTNLPYFPHSLELLLHEVLEEEATTSHPIPDALLPRVVDFIREFPVFLQTIVHCARKTELALWPHLFAVVGNPKDLFQKCLSEGQLETAASYIIVLQNLEKSSISRHYASLLLESARNAGCFQVVKDLARFLRAIDSSEGETSVNRTSTSSTSGIFGSDSTLDTHPTLTRQTSGINHMSP